MAKLHYIFTLFSLNSISSCAIIYITFNGGDIMSKLSAKMPDGRMIYGAAAQQHIIKEDGGWYEHHRKFTERVINTVIKEYQKELTKKAFTVVNGKRKTSHYFLW